jgi:phosphomannomutase
MSPDMKNAHEFHSTVLREYDIRGVVGDTLGEDDARAIGRAFGTRVVRAGGKRVATGRDGRLSSPALEAALVEGLVSTGLEVIRVGTGPTPMLYFSVYHLEADGGVMVTGSHNPPDFNGFKMMLGTAPFFGEDIQKFRAMAAAADFETGTGSSREQDVQSDYIARMLRDFKTPRDLNVVWDCGNGSTGLVMEEMCAQLPGQQTLLFPEIDGTFPNHHPDPTVEANLVDLVAKVKELGADIGIGFDGDGDRLGVVDDQGRVLWGDQILALLAEDVLAEFPGATVIADVKASQVLFDRVRELGGVPVMWKSGHSLIKQKMAETGSPLGGEMSGHIFIKDRYYGFDCAPYDALRMLEYLSSREGPLSELRKVLPEMMNTPEIRFDCPEDVKFGVVTKLQAHLAANPDAGDVTDVDGVRVNTADGWWLLRASNTQPALVARCEAADAAGLARLKTALSDALRTVGMEPPSF